MPTAFSEVEFPRHISYGSKGGPGFKTTVFSAASGFEQRNSVWQEARATYDVSHGLKDRVAFEELMAFFYNMRGRATGFRFYDWADNSLTAQLIGTGNGVTTSFQISKTYTTGAQAVSRTIRKLVTGTLVGVRVNTVLQVLATDYTVNINTGIITFTVPPANTHTVTIDSAEFHVPVRFDTDKLDISIDAFEIGSWQSIPLVEIKL